MQKQQDENDSLDEELKSLLRRPVVLMNYVHRDGLDRQHNVTSHECHEREV